MKKVPAKKAAGGPASAKSASAKDPAAKKAPAKDPAAKKGPAKKSAAQSAPRKDSAAKSARAKDPAAKKALATKSGGSLAEPPASPSSARPSVPTAETPPEPSPAAPSESLPDPAGAPSPAPDPTPEADLAPAPRRRGRSGGRFRRPEIVSQPTTAPIPKPAGRDPRRIQQRVAVVIPAKDEARRIAATVRAAKAIPQVDLVLVVDDGSEDNTQHLARDAGAVVVRHSHNRGKAAAMETGAAVVAMRDVPERPARLLLFIDADLGATAVNTAPLIPPVAEHAADFAIALLPPQVGAGGRGLVVSAARKGIAALTGWAPTQPLSGMRCLTRAAFEAATPLARGWGVETGMTIDLLRQGFVAVEVPCDLRHRPSGNDLGGQLHRAAQYRDVKLAISARQVRGAASALKRAVTRQP